MDIAAFYGLKVFLGFGPIDFFMGIMYPDLRRCDE